MNRSTMVVTAALLSALAGGVGAAEHFVSTKGQDTNPGTREAPFRTIQKAADVMTAGDTCTIRGGTYRETVRPKSSGTAAGPIRFVAAQDEKAVLDGTEPIEGEWSVHKGAIYKIKASQPVEQLFVDGEMMIEARWPNMRFDQLFDRSAWAQTAKGSRYGEVVDPRLPETGVDWTGALATLNVAHQFYSWTRTVKGHNKGENAFTYDKNLPGITHYADKSKPWEDDYYFLSGKLEALDSPAEWFYDSLEGILYLRADDDRSPADRQVAYKRREYAFDVQKCDYVELHELRFFAATCRFVQCNHCVVDGCWLSFPTYSRRIVEFDPVRGASATTSLQGNHNTVRNTGLAYASGAGLKMHGTSNLVENCIIHDVCWSGTLAYTALRLTGGKTGSESTARRNTLYSAGNSILNSYHGSQVIEYNHVFDGGLLCRDVSLIYTHMPECAGSIIRYNWVHGCRTEGFAGRGMGGMGIRGDDQTRYLTVHHNVVWDCGIHGIIVKGDYNRVFNNTVFDVGPRDTAKRNANNSKHLLIPANPEPRKPWRKQAPLLKTQNANSLFVNNAVGNIVWRGKPFPPGIKLANNVELGSEPPEKWFVDPKNMDFQPPKGSPLIDAGMEVPEFTGRFNGEAPDVGAYEYAEPKWTAGADWQDDWTASRQAPLGDKPCKIDCGRR